MFVCQYCCDVKNTIKSVRSHERLCKSNPNRAPSPFSNPDVYKNRKIKKKNNQYTKAKETGVEYSMSDETRKKLSDAIKNRSPELLEKVGKSISESVNKKVSDGTWHTSLAKRMHVEYKGVGLHGLWELKYAQYLDEIGVVWERNTASFPYEFEGKVRRYTPDFYLPMTDEYVEIKGYKTEKDEAKWSQFPLTLVVLMGEDLKSLGIQI